MKPLFVLMLSSMLVLSGVSMSAAADRDAADRQTRQESDELRADIRQQRLKRLKALDDLAQPQQADQQAKGAKGGPKFGE